MATIKGKSVDWVVMDEWSSLDSIRPIGEPLMKFAPKEDFTPSFKLPDHLLSDPSKEHSKAVVHWPKRAGKTAAMEKTAEAFKAAAASLRSFGETYTTSSVTNPCSEIELSELSKRRDDLIDMMNWAMEHRITEDIIKGSMWAKTKPEPEEPERGPLWGTW